MLASDAVRCPDTLSNASDDRPSCGLGAAGMGPADPPPDSTQRNMATRTVRPSPPFLACTKYTPGAAAPPSSR